MESRSLDRGQYLGVLEIYAQTHAALPHPVANPNTCRFCIGTDLDWDSDVLGRTWYFAPRVVWLSEMLGNLLKSSSTWNAAAGTVMHELTHVAQMEHLWFPLLNIPIVRRFTLEAWAGRNGRTAYDVFRYDLIKER